MRYEIDKKHEIVDFYIADEHGREHHSGLHFDEAMRLCREIIRKIPKNRSSVK